MGNFIHSFKLTWDYSWNESADPHSHISIRGEFGSSTELSQTGSDTMRSKSQLELFDATVRRIRDKLVALEEV